MYVFVVFFFKQKTAYEMRISDWSSDVCSSDLAGVRCTQRTGASRLAGAGAGRHHHRGGAGGTDQGTAGDAEHRSARHDVVARLDRRPRTSVLASVQRNAMGRSGAEGAVALQIGRAAGGERVCQYV